MEKNIKKNVKIDNKQIEKILESINPSSSSNSAGSSRSFTTTHFETYNLRDDRFKTLFELMQKNLRNV